MLILWCHTSTWADFRPVGKICLDGLTLYFNLEHSCISKRYHWASCVLPRAYESTPPIIRQYYLDWLAMFPKGLVIVHMNAHSSYADARCKSNSKWPGEQPALFRLRVQVSSPVTFGIIPLPRASGNWRKGLWLWLDRPLMPESMDNSYKQPVITDFIISLQRIWRCLACEDSPATVLAHAMAGIHCQYWAQAFFILLAGLSGPALWQ